MFQRSIRSTFKTMIAHGQQTRTATRFLAAGTLVFGMVAASLVKADCVNNTFEWVCSGTVNNQTYTGHSFKFLNGVIGTITILSGSGGGELNFSDVQADSTVNLFNQTTSQTVYAGLDILFQGFNSVTIYGGNGNDYIVGTNGSDALYGGGGNDYIEAADGDDVVYTGEGTNNVDGGGGDDELNGGSGIDRLYGGGGNNILRGAEGNDILVGGDDNDKIYAGDGNDIVNANGGDDLVNGGSGNDNMSGNEGNDKINGDDGDDLITGGDGSDTINGGEGIDTLHGGAETDTINGEGGSDDIMGEDGSDILSGGAGDDRIWGQEGDDTLNGGIGNDQLMGGLGDDQLNGNDGDDRIWGNEGSDILSGGIGNDRLNGNEGDDQVTGNEGDDVLIGNYGVDTLDGSSGIDTHGLVNSVCGEDKVKAVEIDPCVASPAPVVVVVSAPARDSVICATSTSSMQMTDRNTVVIYSTAEGGTKGTLFIAEIPLSAIRHITEAERASGQPIWILSYDSPIVAGWHIDIYWQNENYGAHIVGNGGTFVDDTGTFCGL